MLIFYTVDERYLLLSIPIFIIAICLSIDAYSQLVQKHLVVFFQIVCIVVALQLWSQKPLITQLFADSILHHSEAWQYQSIKQFDSYFKNQDSSAYLITSLPPMLVEAYQTTRYQALPLSTSQEFINKQEYIWGPDVPYSNLIEGYKEWLQEGRQVYISNAYITQQQSVITDYELYKNNFELEQVSEGCLSACNIYKLHLKETSLAK